MPTDDETRTLAGPTATARGTLFVADIVASELDQVVATRKADVETVEASSPIVLDDINGDGQLDLVQVIWMQERVLVFAMQASTGMDLRRFPMELDGGYSRVCLLYTSPSPRDLSTSRMPSSA